MAVPTLEQLLEVTTPDTLLRSQYRLLAEYREQVEKLKNALPPISPLGSPEAGQAFRCTSDSADFPYRSSTVPFIKINRNRFVTTAQKPKDKFRMLITVKEGDLVLAVWPGQWRSDVFIVDDIEQAIQATKD